MECGILFLYCFSQMEIGYGSKSWILFLGRWTKLPSPDVFGKSLYTFYIGQNDFTSNLGAIGIGGVKQYLPQVVSQIAGTIKVCISLSMCNLTNQIKPKSSSQVWTRTL